MSSISRLPLTKAVDEHSKVGGWDEQFGDESWQSLSFRASIASHAVAHQTVVCGTNNRNDEEWIAWTTSFAPHRVCRVANNNNGTIIAASLDNGVVSIMRGSDGVQLVTRRVASEGMRIPAEIFFISGEHSDILVIDTPEDGHPIMVSNINGERLNDRENKGIVSEATRSMVIHELEFEGFHDIRAIQGCYFEQHKVRFALVDGDGKLAIYDYLLEQKKAVLLQKSLSVGGKEEDWEIDLDTGLRLQTVGSGNTYLVLGAYSRNENTSKLCWFDLEQLVVSQDHILSKNGLKRSRFLALEPIESQSKVGSLAVVVALKRAGDRLETTVLQAAFDDGVVGQPHAVYKIPVPQSVQSISIASLSVERHGPFSFRCKTWLGGDKHDCHSFSTANQHHDGSAIASIRLLAMREQFEGAESLVHKIGADALVNDPFAQFHTSEIYLRSLNSILSKGSVENENTMNISRECIRQLVSGALSGMEHGQRALLSAANSILQWPDETALQNPPTISEVTMALVGFISEITNLSDAFRDTLASEFETKQRELEEKHLALKYLQSIVDKDVPINSQFAGVGSIKDLFLCLIQNNYFLAAEQMWRSDLRSKITSDSMVSALLGVSSTVNPRRYASLLQDTIKGLAINHQLLPALHVWSCKNADEFDDKMGNQSSLDDAIFLLEIVERATKDLRVRVHSSFSSYAPFVEKSGVKRRKVISPRNASVTSSTLDLSFSSNGSSHVFPKQDQKVDNTTSASHFEISNPSILELSRIKGGAQKARLGQMPSLRLDAIDESEECVESKLGSARCLKHARSLGLGHRIVSLREFSNSGGAQFIAKELVRLFSSAASTHTGRFEQISKHIQNFCKQSAANFDASLIQYANDLCGGKSTSKKAIEESASIARCCLAATTKCQVTLITLRAALFCRFSPSWLSELSQEAIEWASGDSSLRSELEEASRLLLIDGIVGKYCGKGAKELFHVDNPRHALRLLEYVSRHVNRESVLSDMLDLCEAFTHLSREDACSRVIQNAILEGNESTSCSLLQTLYNRNVVLAKSTFSRVISFCIDLVEDESARVPLSSHSSDHLWRRKQVMQVTSCACALAPIALVHIHSDVNSHQDGFSCTHFDETRLESLIHDFQRLKTLQGDYSIFLSIADLHSPKILVETATKLLCPLVESYINGTSKTSRTIATQSKRACSLLACSVQIQDIDLWYAAVGSSACRLAWETHGLECLEFLSDLGALEACDNNLSARCCLAVALSFCMKASKLAASQVSRPGMKYVIMASCLLQDHALLNCPSGLLAKTLSLGDLCDIVSQILVRADEGIGEELDDFRKKVHCSAADKRWSFALSNKITRNKMGESLRIRQPSLHPTWYVGDGLLLPPVQALVRGVDYCKQSMGVIESIDSSTFLLHSFVEGRGAHALALRLVCHSTVTQMCSEEKTVNYFELEDANHQSVTALAERYLGGTGNGITSGVVDSQLAVSFLLCLPLKLAFKVYKSSLPTAITTRDFKRVLTLASIGQMAGSGDLVLSANKNVLSHWKRQHKFVQQCELLALRARWWGILQKYHVKFDPRLFEEGKAKGKYVESLIPSVILSLSKTKKETSFILRTAMDFAEAFGLSSESAVQKYVEFLLSPLESHHLVQPDLEVGSSKTDVRMKLSSLEGVIKNLMRRLDPPAKRVNVLRNCLVSLENSNNGTDYERLSVVLCLYQAELSHLLSEDIGPQKMNSQPYLIELELVDRRRDALAILSSYFQGRKREERPPLSSFFAPLGVDTSTRVSKKTTPRILGNESEGSSEIFDPLKPLEKILRASCSSAVTSNLAPLCLPLGVPRGYIHARSLIARFQMSKVDGVALPSFELDVLPVLSRLKSPTDVAELAEWCSLQYDFENEDKLRCLDHSLNFALRASSEAEQRVNHTSRSGAIESDASESNALERVKRITSAKDMLADRLAINAILSSVGITSEKNCTLSTLLDDLISRLEQEVWNKSEFIPERFVEIFLSQSSLLASEASLCSRKALSVGQFRQLSTLVHRACKSVADKYSHVLVGHIARRLTRRWLFHGDELSSSEEPQEGNPLKENVSSRRVISHLLPEIDEGDTIDFVMDLDRLGEEENTWSADIGSGPSSSQNDSKVTSEEEQSSLKMASSEREKSELQHRRVALRVCFVMAYADGYHPVTTCNMSRDENLKPAVNHARESRISKAKSKGGLLSKIGTSGSKQQHDNVLEHCRELLGIVFAKSGVSDLIEKNLNMSTDSRGGSSGQRKTITFAMRHRALRASSILCPQEALEEVIQEEEYISATPSCSLKKCSFGSFVAKEIEEMGLPLPHSDLTQLSTMHFPSYARTLWRHHRDGKGSKGRILVLILEMYLKDTVSDFGFVISVLTEMITLNLPRSLLIALECVCSYMERKEPAAISSFMEGAGSVIGTVLSKVSGMIFAELKKAAATILVPVGSQDITDGLETLRRLGFVVGSISDSSIGQQNLVIFIESLLSSTDELSETEYSECINDIMINSLRRVGDKDTSKGLAEQFLKSTRKVSLSLPRFEPVTDLENDALCSSLEQLESSLDSLSRD